MTPPPFRGGLGVSWMGGWFVVWGVDRHLCGLTGLLWCCCRFCIVDRSTEVCREGESVLVVEGYERRELVQRGLRDVLLARGVLAPGVEDADRCRPPEHCAMEGGHGMFESLLPSEGLVVGVNHSEIPVKGVEGVPDERARLCADELAA